VRDNQQHNSTVELQNCRFSGCWLFVSGQQSTSYNKIEGGNTYLEDIEIMELDSTYHSCCSVACTPDRYESMQMVLCLYNPFLFVKLDFYVSTRKEKNYQRFQRKRHL
jgi:hypothetical protein